MASITVKQLLHRVSPGVAIGPANPLEVQPYGGEGEPLELATESTLDDVKTAVESIAEKDFATESTLDDVKTAVESIAGEDFATQTTLAALKTEIDKLTALISDSRLKTEAEATLKGRTVERTTVVNAVAISDTTTRTANLTSLIANYGTYLDIEILITNTHNQPCRVYFVVDTAAMRLAKSDGTLAAMGSTTGWWEVPAEAGGLIPLSTLSPKDNTGFISGVVDSAQWKRYRRGTILLAYRFNSAPSSGALTVHVEGVPN